MKNKFKEGDILLYYKKDCWNIVILDEITPESFVIVTHESNEYQYGSRINIKKLNSDYFIKLDSIELIYKYFNWEVY